MNTNECVEINECEKLNPLLRDGTSQLQRLPDSLNNKYVGVDERSLEDILIYIREYSKFIKFFDSTNPGSANLNWLPFIENDITIIIADIIKTDKISLKENFFNLFNSVKKTKNKNDLIPLFEFIFNLAVKIDGWYYNSVKDNSLNKDLYLLISSTLKDALQELLSYYKVAWFVLTRSKDIKIPEYNFSTIWGINFSTGSPDISASSKIFTGSRKTVVVQAASYFNSIFEVFYNGITKTISSSAGYIKETMNKFPEHQPHFALILTFIELFKYAQDNINRITKRHLDFYYKKVLQLKTQDEVPDQVHLIFELAKKFSTYTLTKGTLLKAGKDDTGVEVYYQTDQELVINTATIEAIKSIFVEKETIGDKTQTKIHSAPIANSADGKGSKFSIDEKKWKPFGDKQFDCAEIGFAISSPQFILKEGKRTITLVIQFDKNIELGDNPLSAANFKFYLSGKKRWIEVKSPTVDGKVEKKLTITLVLDEDQPEITAYDKSKLGGTFDTEYPVLKIFLANDNNPYEYLKNLEITGIDINVSVTGVKNLILQNDIGKIDNKKPFQPFGSSPVIGSAFYIGSEEIFNKSIAKLAFYFEWLGIPEEGFHDYYNGYGKFQPKDEKDFEVYTEILDGKQFSSIENSSKATQEGGLFLETKGDNPDSIIYNDLLDTRSEEFESFTEFNYDLKRGFIKLSLDGHDFCHKDYANALTTAVINKDVLNADTDRDKKLDKYVIPKEPYTPLMKSISVDYTSNQNFENDVEKFYHIYPFGEVETFPIKTPSSEISDADTLILNTQELLPQFKVEDEEQEAETQNKEGEAEVQYAEQEGILYLGISKLVPPQNLSLLFQVAEGSGDPSMDVPKIKWSYLSNNLWKELEKGKILSDTTNSFKTTGIIEFDFPSDATDTNTIMPSGYHWLSASVIENSVAVNQMIEILAQAVTASFKNNGNDPNYLSTPLEAKSITKLETRIPEIKSVTQPFASFGGKVKEQGSEFYRRVSERLRHKNRAVNIWDYERLVLENFPSIYKVKCINHTGTESEMLPGNVTVIPISNLRNKNAVDLLEPLTSANTLDEIKKFLSRYNSPFINLVVENPKYEQIKTMFSVKFYKGIDKGTYRNKLIEDITKFLSPWAFDEGSDIMFGGKIHASYIINFIEELSYVDYVKDFKMFHITDIVIPDQSVEVAEATTAKSILASYSNHDIFVMD